MNTSLISYTTNLVIALSMLTSIGTGSVKQARTLPPLTPREKIECHDIAWEKQNLKTLSSYRLHHKLSPFIQKILKANSNLGITSAYRNCTEQARLRIAACGNGEFNVYEKPESKCLPPTAIPGQSLHQEGLAVDFSCQGHSLFETSPCYGWLKIHAADYFLVEHKVEPWHWSTTGL